MTDLISRSAAIDIINEERRFIESLRETAFDNEDRAHNTGELGCAIRLARKIKELLAIDAVPVVRCKDCIYRGLSDCPIFLAPDEGFCHIGSLTGD